MSRQQFPYQVKYTRTADWYSSGGTWYQLSTWLDKNMMGRWEYYDQCFVFKTTRDRDWFILGCGA
jgi:hypothetical protein